MPYRDPSEEALKKAAWHSEKYHTDPDFREAEAARKAAWYSRPEVKAARAKALREWRLKTGRVKNPRK